jgi:hypothetical protein
MAEEAVGVVLDRGPAERGNGRDDDLVRRPVLMRLELPLDRVPVLRLQDVRGVDDPPGQGREGRLRLGGCQCRDKERNA